MRIPQNALEAIGSDALLLIASYLDDPHHLLDSSHYFNEISEGEYWKIKFTNLQAEVPSPNTIPNVHLLALVDPIDYFYNISSMESYNSCNHYKMAYYYCKCFNEFIRLEKQTTTTTWKDVTIYDYMILFYHQVNDSSSSTEICSKFPYKQLKLNSKNCKAHFDMKIMDRVTKMWEEEEKKNEKLKILRMTKPLWIWIKPLCYVYVFIFDNEHYSGNYWFDT